MSSSVKLSSTPRTRTISAAAVAAAVAAPVTPARNSCRSSPHASDWRRLHRAARHHVARASCARDAGRRHIIDTGNLASKHLISNRSLFTNLDETAPSLPICVKHRGASVDLDSHDVRFDNGDVYPAFIAAKMDRSHRQRRPVFAVVLHTR